MPQYLLQTTLSGTRSEFHERVGSCHEPLAMGQKNFDWESLNAEEKPLTQAVKRDLANIYIHVDVA
jgi:hypothetical protein